MTNHTAKTKYWILAALALAYILYFFSQMSVSAPSPLSQAPRVAAVLGSEENMFWNTIWQSLRDEADSAALLLSEYPLENNVELKSSFEMLEIVSSAQPDGLILWQPRTPDTAYTQLLSQMRQKGTKIVALDSNLPDSCADVYIGADNQQVGRELAEFVINHYENQKIVILSYEGNMANTLKTRLDSMVSRFEEAGLKEQLHSLVLPSDSEDIQRELPLFLDDFEEPVWIISAASVQTLYAAHTIAGLALSDKALLVGFGETEESLRYVQDGIIQALAVQDTQSMAQLAIKNLTLLLSGETLNSSSEYVDAAILDSENVESYLASVQF